MKWTRRDILKSIGGIPILGGVWWAGAYYMNDKTKRKEQILNALDVHSIKPKYPEVGQEVIRIGIVGFGGRGEHLCRSLGFATKEWLEKTARRAEVNPRDTRLKEFRQQENLNARLTAVCDVFDVRANIALESFHSETQPVIRYASHQEMFQSGTIDAVIIATPDHWHAPIAIEALKHNIHVYVEKPMTHNFAETFALREAVKRSEAVFMVGHQHRQTQSFATAREIIKSKLLGHVSLSQTNTNRNDDNGAWQYGLHPDANERTIDWARFIGNAPNQPFNKEHFFRWRKWWSYGSGLSGDLMTHDYDRLNCVLEMGIPESVMASGGIYTHRDGRTVPDVMHINMEFPNFTTGSSQTAGKERGMTLVYSATLGNQYNRPTLLMGHDATLELGNALTIWADQGSTRYKELLNSNSINATQPIYQFDPASGMVDGVSSATSKYFADKGLLWSYVDGKRVDSTFLHIKEWLHCIRSGTRPSCGIKEGFDEAITAHMAGASYKLGKRIDWDLSDEKVIGHSMDELDEVLLSERLPVA